jgi:hypothetical protein
MMTGNLEYVISSLPNLSFQDSEEVRSKVSLLFKKYALFQEASPNMIAVLNDEAEKYLSSNQFNLFETIDLKTIHLKKFQITRNSALSAFSIYSFQLKQELKAFRLAKKSSENLPKTHYEILGKLSENPLEAEKQLIKLQWDKLESLSIGHYTDFSALIIYKLKLQLLMRWWSFDTNKGFKVFTKTINKD